MVGRLQSCNLVITDPLSSRRHFEILLTGNLATLTDRDSPNGTFLNGKKVEGSVRLDMGSTVRAGETLFHDICPTKPRIKACSPAKKMAGYQLVERIGLGGMGEVYKAMQLSRLGHARSR